MGGNGNRGSSKKSKAKSWRNRPGTSREVPEPIDDIEVQRILPTGGSVETVASSENIVTESEERVTGATNPGRVRKDRRGAIGQLLDRTGLCLCVVYQCAGISHRTCETCNPRRMAGYQKMENERYRAEHPHESVDRDIDQYNSLLLNFYLESATVPEFCPLLVTKHMTAYDAVKGVALNQKNENPHMFSVVEHWKDFEAERVLEDHELIQNVRREQVKFYNNKFVFIYRSDLEKYEYVRDKEDYFVHPDVVRSKSPKKNSEDPLLIQVEDPFYSKKLISISNASLFASPSETSENVVESINAIETIPEEIPERDLVNPIFCGTVYIKQSHKDMTIEEIEKLPEKKEKAQWPKKYLLLRNKTLYLVNNHQNMVKFYHFDDERFNEVLQNQGNEKKQKRPLELIGPLTDFQIYSGLNTRRYHNAPYGGGVYLKRQDGSSKKTIKLMFCCKNNKKLTDPNNFTRKLWLAAMRLAKHGEQIKENYMQYRAAVNEYKLKIRILREANNPRVAMDFSYGVGRVVDDPREAAEIARGEVRGGGSQRSTRFQSLTPAPLDSLRFGPHLTQGYYHGNLSREQAEEMVMKNGTNGAFILRDSKNRPGCLVITYVYALRAHHQYVSPVVVHDKEKKENIFLATVDKDTVFYDVHSLIEYHRLNRGCFHCTLKVSIKNPQQPDGTPPRHRKPGSSLTSPKSRTTSPKAGPSRDRGSLSPSLESTSSLQQSDSERDRSAQSSRQASVEASGSKQEDTSAEPITAKISPQKVDLLTSLEIHHDPHAALRPSPPRPSSSPSEQADTSSDSPIKERRSDSPQF